MRPSQEVATPRCAVLFDLDGVLIDSYEAWFRTVQTARRTLGFGPVGREAFDCGWGQGVEADAAILFPGRTVDEVNAAFRVSFMDEIGSVEVLEGSREVLSRLRRRGHPLAIVTNTGAGQAAEMLAALGLRDRVDTVVASGDVPREKPAPDMVLEACRRLDRSVEQAVVVGDSRYDRDAARAAGVFFVGFRMAGDRRVDRLDEIPGVVEERP